ncbi:Acg family FMN-binding oxidoreductase [Micromonosporaceae bacterium Da 78-11]
MVSNTLPQPAEAQARDQALKDAATAAGSAPSILNTQPWQWQVHGDELELSVDRRRTLEVTDPDGRAAILSCGVALHHARVSLAADGWHTTVTRFPDSAQPGHLATIRADRRIPVESEAVRDLQAIRMRHTDRRPLPAVHIDGDKLRSIVTAAQQQGASLQLLRPDQVFDVAAAANDANRTETGDAAWQAELQHWTGGIRPLDTGLPGAVIPQGMTPTAVTDRDIGHSGDMLIAEAHNRTAVYAILYGSEDRRQDWLRAGEALSAAWLTATELKVSVLPSSVTIEVPATRETVRNLLDGGGWPYLVLRFGVANPTGGAAPHTPRLSTDQIVDRTSD